MSFVTKILDLLPYIGKLRYNLRTQRSSMGNYPAGHYYSPIPNDIDMRRHQEICASRADESGMSVDFAADTQRSILEAYTRYYDDIPWSEQRQPSLRYYFGQEWFCYADAIMLYSHLRYTTPRAVIEVGSGYSSALMLDTAERFLSHKPEFTFIEPNPGRLMTLLRPGDLEQARIITDEVQNVPLSVFTSLQAGDLLFIDSSHVVKAGNDLYFLLFDIIPRLAPGVIVHFHDIFYPFNYPQEWLTMGRYWNEAYFLHAFLAHNDTWRIRLFNSYVGWKFADYLADHMPLCLQNTGGSLYIERQ